MADDLSSRLAEALVLREQMTPGDLVDNRAGQIRSPSGLVAQMPYTRRGERDAAGIVAIVNLFSDLARAYEALRGVREDRGTKNVVPENLHYENPS